MRKLCFRVRLPLLFVGYAWNDVSLSLFVRPLQRWLRVLRDIQNKFEVVIKNIKYVFFATNLMSDATEPKWKILKWNFYIGKNEMKFAFGSLLSCFCCSTKWAAAGICHKWLMQCKRLQLINKTQNIASSAWCVWINTRCENESEWNKNKPTTAQRHNFRGFFFFRSLAIFIWSSQAELKKKNGTKEERKRIESIVDLHFICLARCFRRRHR